MSGRFFFSWRISVIGLILVAGMLRASHWQWGRHIEKKSYIEKLIARLELPPLPLEELLQRNLSAEEMLHRRVLVKGIYDFSEEVVLRNRRYHQDAGVHVITPLKLSETDHYVLVDRGFLPLSHSSSEERKSFHAPGEFEFVGLVKLGEHQRFLAPADPPTGEGHPRVDSWLRIDISKMQKQLPYPISPFYLEMMTTDPSGALSEIVSSSAGREELLVLQPRAQSVGSGGLRDGVSYPIPAFTTIIPAGRHFGYVFEWAVMALVTLLICVALQLRRPTQMRDRGAAPAAHLFQRSR